MMVCKQFTNIFLLFLPRDLLSILLNIVCKQFTNSLRKRLTTRTFFDYSKQLFTNLQTVFANTGMTINHEFKTIGVPPSRSNHDRGSDEPHQNLPRAPWRAMKRTSRGPLGGNHGPRVHKPDSRQLVTQAFAIGDQSDDNYIITHYLNSTYLFIYSNVAYMVAVILWYSTEPVLYSIVLYGKS